ncbi:IS5 family transposase [Streptomyces sp. NRRL S-646]|uniref:IS5 family transposase n=1 Tax=Streptomyces sp. NRRL S-646 TaxID=1463917 RepID=UPI00099D840A|nr:IS5 family transposase [Streptomyces sp. NRRL S-646]
MHCDRSGQRGAGDLSNEEWARLGPHLPKNVGRGGHWKNHRRVINGILFRQRTGIPWRDLPTRLGKWKTVHDRHRRWSADGTWDRILRAVQADAAPEGCIDWSMASVDSTVCRAHQHAADARKQAPLKPGKRTQPVRHRPDEAVGRSRGGLSTKIHLAGQGGLRPLALLVTPGQWGDAPHSRYVRRNEVERTINQLKSFRAVATRFEERDYVFHGTVAVAAVRLWLRS